MTADLLFRVTALRKIYAHMGDATLDALLGDVAEALAIPVHGRSRPVYVASRASLPARPEMWRRFRSLGWRVTSTWIDEAGEGETVDFTDLWSRISREIAQADAVILYAETEDFPLKGALIECGIAIGMGKPVHVVLPGVNLQSRTLKPIGSWLAHPLVTRLMTASPRTGASMLDPSIRIVRWEKVRASKKPANATVQHDPL